MGLIGFLARSFIVTLILYAAYSIRLYAVEGFGMVIHEFDPWFNYRATEYLAQHGSEKFFKWFDHSAWYPLGRPVGTTIYPGMQFTAVYLWRALNAIGYSISLNDVCVMVPAWFGAVATALLGLLTAECTDSVDSGIAAAAVMSIIPGHIMRSVAGGFDNESVAIPALCLTFYLWVRSLRTPNSWPIGVLTGLAYFYMVACWGGYIFVVNMIGAHAGLLILLGRYSPNLHRAYSLFFVIGVSLAVQVPVVGWTPLRSLEQIMPLGMFFFLQVWEMLDYKRRNSGMTQKQFEALRKQAFFVAGAVGMVVGAVLLQVGYFGPLSSRVRGLFVQHTRTGNPLVDSVAEHQATSPQAYWQYLHYMCYLGPIGFGLAFKNRSDASFFLLAWNAITYYFSSKMNRLVLLMGPSVSCLGGVAINAMLTWACGQVSSLLDEDDEADWTPNASPAPSPPTSSSASSGKKGAKSKVETNGKDQSSASSKSSKKKGGGSGSALEDMFEPWMAFYNEAYMLRKAAAFVMLGGLAYFGYNFCIYCDRVGEAMSNPSIMFKSRLNTGESVVIDDYREAYWWLRDNTPEDSRVMAWWDYGYQINGVANRTTIADGNTWNHEHIATLGRCLTNPEKRAYNIVRHLADYVLLWTGGGGDDLAKSPHMARIANSVYHDVCPGDPTCSQFGFDHAGNPTKMMSDSLLFKLHSHNQKQGVKANSKLFKEVYTSKYNLVRIFAVVNVSQESRDWSMNPENFICDAPGSWYCEGQYPPALDSLLKKKKAFKQLEDFNAAKGDSTDEEYQKEYMAKMSARER